MLFFESELKSDAILVLSNLYLVFADSHRIETKFDSFSGSNIDRMRRPLLFILTHKLIVDVLENPVVHEMLFNVAHYI